MFNYAKQVLSVIATEIEKQRGYDIQKYVMIIDSKKDGLFFILNDETEKLPLHEPALYNGIKTYVESDIPKGWYLEYAIISYNKGGISELGLHTVNEAGEKQSSKTNI